ncbi:MAG: M48 family metalloprotease [Acidobacteria bacterium]|nr:M48 family metalloprotease [Acidobacteriota bacterium]
MCRLRAFVFSILACLFFAAFGLAETPALSSISFNAQSVVAGNSVAGLVTLNMPAPFEIRVSLAVDPPEAARVPAEVVVPVGATSANFLVTTGLSNRPLEEDEISVTIYGNFEATRHASFQSLAPVSFGENIDKIVEAERKFVTAMKRMHPLAETYIQNLREDKDHNLAPINDQYFLGRLDMSDGPDSELFNGQRSGSRRGHFLNPFSGILSHKFMARGFVQMIVLDWDFQRSNYEFKMVRHEFLGDIHCLVVDLQPKESSPKGLFTGRIWVEDRDFNIVRFNGTYTPRSRYSHYLHFDSWRSNLQSGVWLPTYVYIEESDNQHSSGIRLNVKAQTRLWGYEIDPLRHTQELVNIQVESARDQSAAAEDSGPLEAERMWERLAEDNAIEHLQKVGLIAPASEVDKILETLVNNLSVGNHLVISPDVRCRVLLTTPLESFTIGHTIVVSRGLLDVLPDEASLAMVLAHELAHIALGHPTNTKFAFIDRFFFPDQSTFEKMDFGRNPIDEQAADRKALELLANSPYKDKLGSAGLFLKALEARAPVLTCLIRPHLGNAMADSKKLRMSALTESAPQLEMNHIEQIAALPLGSRIKVDAWSNQLSLMKPKPLNLLSAREKMPFEITPFFPYLTHSLNPQEDSIARK